MKKALVRRVVSLFLCFCMVIGFVPITMQKHRQQKSKAAHSTRIPVIWNWNLGISLHSM